MAAALAWAGARLTAPAAAPAPAPAEAPAEAPEPPPARTATTPPAPTVIGDKLNDLHAEFIGLIPPEADSPARVREALNGAGYRREYLIVLVPDPLDSTLANNFDFALDALRRAFAAQGYLPDRVYLPWLGDGAKDNRYRREPGILLFRRAAGAERRLATVLLVGERPKTGIHAPAFTAAVEMLRGRAVGTAGSSLFVLGPSFSGSAESLRLALQRLPDLDVEVVTGTATADGLEETLEIAHADDGPTKSAGKRISFCRTVLPDSVLQDEAWKFFEDSLGWDPERIALLVEEDTAYGGGAATGSEEEDPSDQPLLVRFPSGLTEVRKLWETHRPQAESAPAPALPGVATEEAASELSLADPSAPADVGSEFDPLTPRTKELMIANLLESIPRYGVRYVGIVATDTRDKLYLTERMRGFAPGTVLFAFENHLVQAHPRFVRPLRPVLLVGNFPTITDYRPPIGQANAVLRQFGSDFHQGIYRAAELLIGRLRGERVDVGAPRVWITVSAKGTILPVAAIAPAATDARLCPPLAVAGQPSPPSRGGGLPSLGAAGYLIAAIAVGLLLALGFVLSWAVPPGAPRTASLLEALGTAALWLPAAALVLVAFYLPGFWRELWLQGWLVAGLWLAVLAPFAGLTVLLYRSVAGLPAAPGVGMAAGALLPLVLAALLVVPLWPAAAAHDDYLTFLHLRVRQPLSGVSPLPPLLFLGLAAWTWARLEMQRLRQRARFEVDWPIHDASDPALAGCEELVRRVARRTNELLPRSRRFWAITTLALLLPVLALLRAIQPIVEPRRYGWVFFLLALVPFVLAAISFLRFVRIWRHLERLLDRFEQSDLCAALAGIGQEVGWKPISSFSWRMPSFRLLVLSARKLKAVEDALDGGPDRRRHGRSRRRPHRFLPRRGGRGT